MTTKFRNDWYTGAIPDLIGVLTMAAAVAVIWTARDRRRTGYPLLNRWMRVYLRYGLGTAMLSYALIKVIPTQFGYLTPGDLLRPLGQLSHFRLLWDFMISDEHTLDIFHHIPNAQLQIFANAMHTIPFDDPDRFNLVVATFLQKPFVKIDRLGDTMKSLEKLRTAPAK